MRTTVTLEDDLYAQVEKRIAEQDKSFKSAANEAFRLWLHPEPDAAPEGTSGARYETRTFDLGTSSVTNMDNVAELIAMVEGDDYK